MVSLQRQLKFSAPFFGIEYRNQDLRIDFYVEKEFTPEGNSAKILIYNLNNNVKQLLSTPNLEIRLEAGNECFPQKLIFIGQIYWTEETWQDTDNVFAIFAVDGGAIYNRFVDFTADIKIPIVENVRRLVESVDRRPFLQQGFEVSPQSTPDTLFLNFENALEPEIGFNSNEYPQTAFDKNITGGVGKFKDVMNKYALDHDFRIPFFWSIQDGVFNMVDGNKTLNINDFVFNQRTPIIGLPKLVVYRNVKARFEPRGDTTLKEIPDFKVYSWNITTFVNADIKPLAPMLVELSYPTFKINGGYKIINVTHSGSNWTDEFYTNFEIIEKDLDLNNLGR